MRQIYILATTLVILGTQSACGLTAFPGRGLPFGLIYTGAHVNKHVTQNPLGTKTGRACATNVLGLVTVGNASVERASHEAGIVRIASVDESLQQVLGIWTEFCTEVTGDDGEASIPNGEPTAAPFSSPAPAPAPEPKFKVHSPRG